MDEQAALAIPRMGDNETIRTYREPLTPTVKRLLVALVIFLHVGGGWALTQVEPVKLVVGDIAPMEVRMVSAEQPAEPVIENAEPPPPVDLKPPPPDLATVVEPPPPDLPPPVFPVEAKPATAATRASTARTGQARAAEAQATETQVASAQAGAEAAPRPPHPPAEARPQQAAPSGPAAPAGPRTVSASQLGYRVPPNPIYPARSRRAGEQGSVVVRVLIDVTGRPAQVSLQTSSGHPALDESALSAVRAAQFRPYAEGGLPQAVWVLVPINFVLR